VRWVFIIEIWYKLGHERRVLSGVPGVNADVG
jgi:hypothetical protein